MRALLVIAALFCAASVSPASAQAAPESEDAAIAAAQIAAARDMLAAIVIESGAVRAISDEIAGENLALTSRAWQTAPIYRQLSSERRARVDAYFTALPAIITEELELAIRLAVAESAPQIATLFTREHLLAITAYARSAEGREEILAHAMASLRGETESDAFMTFADTKFGRTPAGRAFAVHEEAVGEVLATAFDRAFSTSVPAVQQRIEGDLCGILAEQCPGYMRGGGVSPT